MRFSGLTQRSPNPNENSCALIFSVSNAPQIHPLRCQSIEHSKALSAPPFPAARLCQRSPLARGGGSLAPRRSKAAPKTGDHRGIMRKPQRHRASLTAFAIPHALGEGHRALRAPASPSVPSAGSQTPGVKSGCGSLRLSRHWLPQLPALRAAPACLDDAGSTGGLAHCCKLPAFMRSKEVPKTGNHGGKVRQPKRHCLLLTDAGIPHLLENSYRALRAPASALMPSASPEAPGPRAAAHCC